MVTGASTADLAIVLVDARNGVVEQSQRHAFIASLLGIPHLVVAVNKMDLVDYDEERLRRDRRATSAPSRAQLDVADVDVHPDLARCDGDNVVDRSRADALVRRADAARPPRDGRRRVATATSTTCASPSSG